MSLTSIAGNARCVEIAQAVRTPVYSGDRVLNLPSSTLSVAAVIREREFLVAKMAIARRAIVNRVQSFRADSQRFLSRGGFGSRP